MPRTRSSTSRLAGVLAAGVLAALLTGCAGTPAPSPSPTPSATAAPIFASDEEALAAAEAAYREYSELINLIANENNSAPERIRSIVTVDYAKDVEGLFKDLSQRGLVIQGATTVDSFRLVEAAEVNGRAEVMMLVCSDVSGSRVVDAAGIDVTPAGRPDRSALQVKVVSASDDARRLIVDEEDPWLGDYC